MITSFQIRKFRCFQDLELGDLAPANLIVGANNVGKTSVLEGLYLNLGAHNPALSMRLNILRGFEKFANSGDEIWGWLFNEKHVQEPIQLDVRWQNGFEQRLTIRLGPPRKFDLKVDQQPELAIRSSGGTQAPLSAIPSQPMGVKTAVDVSELTFEFNDSGGQHATSRAFLSPEGELKIEPAKISGLRKASFQSTRARYLTENAAQFSRLRATGRQGEVIGALRSVDERLQSLDILVIGGEPVIHGDIGTEQLLPLPLMGEGFNRILSIILAILDCPDGAVLVDEIENGLHYTAMEKLWSAILTAAKSANVQVFATTHSRECLLAARQATENNPDDLAVYRLQRVHQQLEAIRLGAKHLKLAAEMGLEVRS